MKQQQFFWDVTVRCANCGETEPVDQPGATPHSWIGLLVSERKAAIARTPQEAVNEVAQYETRPYPTCGAACGAKLLIAKALGEVRTKAERITLIAQLKEIIDGDGEVRPRPN